MSVTEVMVIDTAASLKVSLILSGTLACNEVRRHAPSITKVSSMPIPNIRKGAAKFMPIKGMPQYMIVPKEAMVATFEEAAQFLGMPQSSRSTVRRSSRVTHSV